MAEQWYNPASGVAPEVGQWLHGARKGMLPGTGKTGWVWDGSTWVQMKNGEPTGQTRKNPENTNLLGKTTNSLKNLFLGGGRNKLKVNNTKNLTGKYQQGLTLNEHKANILNRIDTGREKLNEQEQNAWYSPFLPENNQTYSKKSKLKFKDLPGLSQGAKDAQAMARARIKAGKSTLGDFGSGEDRGKLAAQYAAKNKKKLKFTKEQKKWLKENPSGTFINDDGIDQAYSPEFDLIRFNQAKKHKQWLIDNKRV